MWPNTNHHEEAKPVKNLEGFLSNNTLIYKISYDHVNQHVIGLQGNRDPGIGAVQRENHKGKEKEKCDNWRNYESLLLSYLKIQTLFLSSEQSVSSIYP
jgi:hypothetical protein